MKAKKRGEGEEEEEKKKKNKRSMPKVRIFGVWYGFLYGICKDPWFYIYVWIWKLGYSYFWGDLGLIVEWF